MPNSPVKDLFYSPERVRMSFKEIKKDSVAHLGVPHCLNYLNLSCLERVLTLFQKAQKRVTIWVTLFFGEGGDLPNFFVEDLERFQI